MIYSFYFSHNFILCAPIPFDHICIWYDIVSLSEAAVQCVHSNEIGSNQFYLLSATEESSIFVHAVVIVETNAEGVSLFFI